MGHEFIGVVEDTGADVTSVQKGDLVIAPFAWSDGTRYYCREGLHTLMGRHTARSASGT